MSVQGPIEGPCAGRGAGRAFGPFPARFRPVSGRFLGRVRPICGPRADRSPADLGPPLGGLWVASGWPLASGWPALRAGAVVLARCALRSPLPYRLPEPFLSVWDPPQTPRTRSASSVREEGSVRAHGIFGQKEG